MPFFPIPSWLLSVSGACRGDALNGSEEAQILGPMELVMTLPGVPRGMLLGKFLAAGCFIGLSLLLTFPIILTVNLPGFADKRARDLYGYLAAGCWRRHIWPIGLVHVALDKE